MTKILNIHLKLTLEPDEFGLHALQADTRQWLTELRDNAKGHGFTVVIDPVEDAKGLVQVRKRTRGPGKRKQAALSVVPDVA